MKSAIFLSLLFVCLSCNAFTDNDLTPRLTVSKNHRFLATEKGDPFFWLGDTGWLLPSKLSREEAEVYLEDRKQKGFNVIQISVLHGNSLRIANFYGDSALIGRQIDKPLVTPGNSFDDPKQYDYWDNVDYIIDAAARKGIYIGIVMLWGGNIRAGMVTIDQVKKYGEWIANRYKTRSNVIWINGGDVRGTDSTAIWNALGATVRKTSPDQLITYHPWGRTQSSMWFHNEPWLDMNMFQSGHQRYEQDTVGLAYGEDNWRYAVVDYAKIPAKPTLDGEPSYEGWVGWTDKEIRRYGYWSVFAGGCGFTYGHGVVQIMVKKTDKVQFFGSNITWDVAINAPGASQMQYMKQLMLSKPYFERVPANDLLAEEQGKRYDYIAVTRGNDYVFAYTWNGRNFSLNLQKMPGSEYNASWFDPRTGTYTAIGTFKNSGVLTFDPPGEKEPGNDWVLVLEKV